MTDDLLKYFAYKHLPDRLQHVSSPFWLLAHGLLLDLPANSPMTRVALHKLLEAKDAAVRARAIDDPEVPK
jgi:hypothetical protein